MSNPYEPWVPSAGQRVRVRVSPECPVRHDALNGATGTMVEANWSAALGEESVTGDPGVDAYRGHWYVVDFDTPILTPLAPYPLRGDLFAALELEPIDD